MFDDKYTDNGEYQKESSSENNSYETYEFSSDYDEYKDDISRTGNGAGGGRSPKNNRNKFVIGIVAAVLVGIIAGAGVSQLRTSTSTKTAASASAVESQDSYADAEDSDATEEDNTAAEDNDVESEDSNSYSTSLLNVSEESKVVTTDVTEVVDAVMPSIVSVYNSYTTSSAMMGQVYEQEVTSTGSGIIVAQTEDELLIVTNNHVVENADELSVLFIDQTTAEAQIKGTDSTNDLAVIAVSLDGIDSETLDSITVAKLGDSDSLKVGEPAIAIGNALGIGQSVTTGVISAVNREITTDNSTGDTGTFIQTDAAINEGNSGGALVNINGEVIGINSNKIGGTTVEGMGFAIPMSKALPIIEELMQQETKTKVDEDQQGVLGISGASVTSDIASVYGMPEGVYVAQIVENGGASYSDLEKGDIITAINGSAVSSMDELKTQLQYYEAGTTVTLTVQRDTGSGNYEELSIDVTLGTQDSISSQNSESNYDGYNNDEGTRNQSFSFPFGN